MTERKIPLDPKKTIFLIDGSSFLYRAYYGLKPLHTPDGRPIQAIYSFIRMIKKLMTTFAPNYLVLVWDSAGKTERHDLYKDYKAQRLAAPSDLFDQRRSIIQFADLIELKQIEVPGIEADDIMFSIAQEQKKAGQISIFITSDKDMSQAIEGQKIMRFDPFKDRLIDEQAFEELRGFPVKKLPFYFSLLGDASDNIPGVRGIGKKGAAELVARFESLKDLYQNLDKVTKPRLKVALEQNKNNAFLSEQLFLLLYKPTGLTKKDFAFDPSNWSKARPLFAELNFKSLIKDLDKEEGTQPEPVDPRDKLKQYTFKTISTQEELEALAKKLQAKKKFALDTETNGLSPLQSQLVGLSIACDADTAYYIPVGHKTEQPQLSLTIVKDILNPVLEDVTIEKYLHNAKFDQLVLWSHGITLKGIAFDSLLAARLVCKGWQRIGLKALSEFFFQEQMVSYKEIVTDQKLKDFSYVPLEIATRYAAADALQTFRLQPLLIQKLKEEGMWELYQTTEHPMLDVLFEMEKEGINLDVPMLTQLGKQVDKALSTVEKKIDTLLGPDHQSINLRSPKQIEKLLFEDLGLPPQKKSTKKTRYSTDHAVLIALAHLHPIAALILKHRELSKLKNTYIDALVKYVHPKTKRLHTSYSQTIVATGRLASSNPNLQNIPTDNANGLSIRGAFRASAHHLFMSADYSQIELRILAQLSQDKALLDAFAQGQDIHARTAAGLFGIPIDQITIAQRQVGKRINFSILYGLTPYGLSKDLGIPIKQAKEYIDAYFKQYPAVSSWMARTIEFAKEQGYVQTMWGRRRYIPAIHEQNKTLYEEACRIAINTVAQGTAADIIKQGMIQLRKALRTHNLDAKILLQIHDELLLSVPEHQHVQTQKVVKEVLEGVTHWILPLEATIRVGRDWKAVTK